MLCTQVLSVEIEMTCCEVVRQHELDRYLCSLEHLHELSAAAIKCACTTSIVRAAAVAL
jgi:hypothetical protein